MAKLPLKIRPTTILQSLQHILHIYGAISFSIKLCKGLKRKKKNKIYFSAFSSSRNSRYFIETAAASIIMPLNKNQNNPLSVVLNS